MSRLPKKKSGRTKSRAAKPRAKRAPRTVRKPRGARPSTSGAGASRKLLDQREAELAIISSVQQGLAAQRGFQAIVDLVGDKMREIFHNRDMEIRIYDPRTDLMHYSYYYEKGKRHAIPSDTLRGEGILGHLLRTRETLVINENMEQVAKDLGSAVIPGTEPGKSSVYVPLVSGDQTRGLLALFDMEREHAFSKSDVRLLETLANSMSVALENARLFDEAQQLLKETEQRAAELAVINSIQEGIAAKLDFQAIVDLVGDKLRDVFATGDIGINWHDRNSDRIHYLYQYEHGVRLHPPPVPSSKSPSWSIVGQRRRPVVGRTTAELEAIGFAIFPGTDPCLSAVYVPILGKDGLLGVIYLGNFEREHAFDGAAVRLLGTVAASMGVALENAQLFDTTQHLLKETEQRNAELAIINSVQAALAAELDIQGIYDAVGDKIRAIFSNADVCIRIYDRKTNLIRCPFFYEDGTRMTIKPYPLPERGFAAHVLHTRETLVINEDMARTFEKYGSWTLPGTKQEKSGVWVPLIVGEEAKGIINLFDMEREHAFSDSDVRLLQTLANSMSVALENARLFDETQHLLKETEQRAAELAVINSVQAALAAELDIQGIYDAVGDKIRSIFNKADVWIRTYDPKTGLIRCPYCVQRGKRLSLDPYPVPERGFSTHVLRTRETLVINDNIDGAYEKYGGQVLPGTRREKSCVWVPLVVGEEARGIVNLFDSEREHAFSDSDVRLLQTLANSMSVALENARLFDETQRRSRETAALAEVGRDISSTLELATVMDRIARHAMDLLHAQNSAIFLPESAGGAYHAITAIGDVAEQIKAMKVREGSGILGSVLQTGHAEFVNDTEADPRTIQIPGTPRRSEERLMVAPLLAGTSVKGAMAVWRRGGRAFEDAELQFLVGLSLQAAVAIENARLFRELEQKSRELEAASRHKSEFLANMSHELRTPLNAIIGFSEVLGDRMFGEINDKQAEYVGDILESGRHLLSLINDILDLSKIEAGRMELEPGEFDLPKAIDNTLILVRERAQRRGIALGCAIDEAVGTIRADERKVKQVMLNLLSNALKFTPEGGRIDVRADLRDGMAEIAVTDTGVGIAPEDQQNLFEEFRQVGTAAKKSEGTGLGLAISRKFIELHGGKIWVTSQPGTGSTFTFTLPLKPVADAKSR
jgi:signal transduction histidine kinase